MTQRQQDFASNSRRPLPESAFDYARDQLWVGRKLGKRLAAILEPQAFSVWTWASPDAPDEHLTAFRKGGLKTDGDVWRDAVRDVAGAMAIDDGRVWVVPHSLARPGDPFLGKSPCDYIAVLDDVYYVTHARDEEDLTTVWRCAAAASGQMGTVTRADSGKDDITVDDIEGWARSAELVVISAYDGDGVIIFERSG